MEFAPLNGRTEFFCVWLPHLLGATENLWLANTMKVAADCQHQPRKLKLKKKKKVSHARWATRTLQTNEHRGKTSIRKSVFAFDRDRRLKPPLAALLTSCSG